MGTAVHASAVGATMHTTTTASVLSHIVDPSAFARLRHVDTMDPAPPEQPLGQLGLILPLEDEGDVDDKTLR